MVVDRFLHEPRGPILSQQVQRDRRDAIHAVQVLGGPRPGNDVGAFGDERPGDGEPDALVRAGHHRDFVRQLEVHRSPLLWVGWVVMLPV